MESSVFLRRNRFMLFSLLRGRLDFTSALMGILACLVIIFLVLPFHEWAHGYAAYKLGDNTAKYSGRLKFNPLAHIDPFGALCLLLFNFGWAKPVPVDPRNFKRPKTDMAIVALCGPLANIIAAVAGGLILNAMYVFGGAALLSGGVLSYVAMFLFYYIDINIFLAVFNIIPIPPLDGSKILFAFLPDRIVYKIYQYERFFFIAIYLLLFLGFLTGPLNFLSSALQNFVMWLTRLPFLPFV